MLMCTHFFYLVYFEIQTDEIVSSDKRKIYDDLEIFGYFYERSKATLRILLM